MTPETFARRRRAFLNHLPAGSAALLVSAPTSIRSNDVEYRYRQDNNLYYLTGFPEPESAALFLPGAKDEFVLFVRPRDVEREIWNGHRAGVEGALERYGASAAHTIDKLEAELHKYVADRDRLYVNTSRDPVFNRKLPEWLQYWQHVRARTGGGPAGLLEVGEIVHEMRLHKEPDEIEAMRRACAISAEAHAAALTASRPGVPEFVVEAALEYAFRRGGGMGPAYPSIVASGANATVLHYVENDREMRDGELLLIDAGAEYDYYCADVTRTFPVGGKFTEAQRAIYDVVLAAQIAAIDAIAPGVRVEDVHAEALRILVDGLLQHGILSGTAEEILEKELYKPFYMHRTSHWLGMDVHDVGLYKADGASRALESGMVLTVEPGLYVSATNEEVDPRWRGIGVRIEDDVLVTADGKDVLTAAIPKQVADIVR